MEREGKSPTVTADRHSQSSVFQSASHRGRVSFIGSFLRLATAVLLIAGLLPLVPGMPVVEKAEAFEGTTDYSKVFEGANVFGKPAGDPVQLVGSTARLASTSQSSHYIVYNGVCESVAAFVTAKSVSLNCSWDVTFDAAVPGIPIRAEYDFVHARVIFGLQRAKDFHNTTASSWSYDASSTKGSSAVTTIFTQDLKDNLYVGVPSNVQPVGWSNKSIRLHYDAKTETGTMTVDSSTISLGDLRKSFGSSAYLFFEGCIEWVGKDGAVQMTPPSNNMRIAATFKSMSLPNLTPEMGNEPKAFADHDIAVYRADGTTRIRPTDSVSKGERVLVIARARNANSAAASAGFEERYPMHLRLSSAVGATPLIDGSHPVTVQVPGESPVSITDPAKAVECADGVPLELVGYNKDTVVRYWATIDAAGNSVDLTHELVEDSFQGRQSVSVHLVDAKPLDPAPGGADPSDPDSGAGTAWHYTRLPAANANGWNNSPVTLTFYPGDYDKMELTPSGQSTVTLTGASPAWTQTADTAGTDLAAQAKNTSTNAVSVTRAGKVKVDTSAPRVEKGSALTGWTASDAPTAPGKATSGVWRLYRTGKAGAAGVAAAGSRAAAYKEFPLAGADGDKAGNAAEALGNLPNGWYVAEDAAGNLSAPTRVSDTEPPAVGRPDPDAPDAPGPAGPAYDPGSDLVPSPRETEDDEGLRHAVIEETVTEVIDPSAPSFGGVLDVAKASAMLDYRYAATSTAAPLTVSDSLLDAAGNSITSFDTTRVGECLMRRVITDAQGNTTTVLLTYRLSNPPIPDPPSVTVRPDPDDPDGGSGGDGPLPPAEVTVDPDTGLSHAVIEDTVTVGTNREPMTPQAMADLMRQRYNVASALPDGELTYGTPRLFDSTGAEVQVIDRNEPGDWRIEQCIEDSAGNTTTIKLAYLVREGSIGGTVGGDGAAGSAGNGSGDGSGISDADRSGAGSRWASMVHRLPQTGGILGPCPLHILFVLIMVLASAYTLMRMRQESCRREERRRNAEWEEACRETVR